MRAFVLRWVTGRLASMSRCLRLLGSAAVRNRASRAVPSGGRSYALDVWFRRAALAATKALSVVTRAAGGERPYRAWPPRPPTDLNSRPRRGCAAKC
jgi:hypothetical protein